MKYKEYNDSELISYIKEQNEEANEIIYEKYKPLIVSLAKKNIRIYNKGLDISDLIAEGMLGLSNAIQLYNEENYSNFYSYAKKCIDTSMLNLIKSINSKKNMNFNEAISYDNTNDEYNIDGLFEDNKNNPELLLIDNENNIEFETSLKDILTKLEYDVYRLKTKGYDNIEIAELLDKNKKDISNAVYRLKNKIKNRKF